MITPTRKAPSLVLPTVYHSEFNLFNEEPVKKRTSGGSVPISPFVNTLGIPAVTVPTVNQDNNQHSPNENIKIENYITGIQTYLGILTDNF